MGVKEVERYCDLMMQKVHLGDAVDMDFSSEKAELVSLELEKLKDLMSVREIDDAVAKYKKSFKNYLLEE